MSGKGGGEDDVANMADFDGFFPTASATPLPLPGGSSFRRATRTAASLDAPQPPSSSEAPQANTSLAAAGGSIAQLTATAATHTAKLRAFEGETGAEPLQKVIDWMSAWLSANGGNSGNTSSSAPPAAAASAATTAPLQPSAGGTEDKATAADTSLVHAEAGSEEVIQIVIAFLAAQGMLGVGGGGGSQGLLVRVPGAAAAVRLTRCPTVGELNRLRRAWLGGGHAFADATAAKKAFIFALNNALRT